MSTRIFTCPVPVAFADIDLAKVLYFPRLFHYCHLVMEAFFESAVGIPYPKFLSERNHGFPTVHTEADYHAPIRYGDRIEASFSVRRIGSSSVDLRFRFFGAGEPSPRCEARSTVVCVLMDRFASVPVPDDVRQVLESHLEA